MLMAMLRSVRINQHSANGISHAVLNLKGPMLGVVVARVSFVVTVFGGRRPCMSGTATGAAARALRWMVGLACHGSH